MKKPSSLSRPLVRLAMVAFAALFIMAPTPGDVGGCSDSNGGARLQPLPGQTQEFTYFDEGLCSGFCYRLRECGALCAVVTGLQNCNNDSPDAFDACVRGQLNPNVVHLNSCPHACPSHYRFAQGATNFDVQACTDAISTRTCNQSGTNSIGDLFTDVPGECTNLCIPTN